MKRRYLGLSALAALPLMAPSGGVADERSSPWLPPNNLAALVREATKQYHDVNVALQMNYLPGPCVSGANGGAMGVHFVNDALVDDAPPDVRNPEVLIYEPLPGGRYRLVGAEYLTFAPPPATLEGHLLNYAGSPNRYGIPAPYLELHVWAWKANPNGTFADWNPRVTCDAYVAPPA